MITIESREPREIGDHLVEYGQTYSIARFSPGDYIVNKWIVERKTWSDFFISYKDARLYEQITALKAKGNAIIVLEGFNLEYIRRDDFFYGLLVEITLSKEIPIFFTNNLRQTAAFLVALHKNQFYSVPINDIRTIRKETSIEQRKKELLLCFPNIGVKRAEGIQKRFPRLKDFFGASSKELKECGLGKKTRKAIKDILD